MQIVHHTCMSVPCVLYVPIRILTVLFPRKPAEADTKKKEAASAKELKAAQKAAKKAEADRQKANSAAVCVQR